MPLPVRTPELVAIGYALVLAEHVADLTLTDTDVARRDVSVFTEMAPELGHERLTKAHDLLLGPSLGIEVRAALAAADGHACQRVLEDLLEAEEFDRAEQHGGMKAQTAFERAEGRVELNAKASIDHVAETGPQEWRGIALVIDGLPVAANQFDGAQRDAAPAASLDHRIRIKPAQAEMQARDLRGVRFAIGNFQNRCANGGRIGPGMKCNRADGALSDIDDSDIDAVERRAAHDAGYSHDRFSSSSKAEFAALRSDGVHRP